MQRLSEVFEQPCKICGCEMEIVKELENINDLSRGYMRTTVLCRCKHGHEDVRELELDGQKAVFSASVYQKKEWKKTKGHVIIAPKCTKCKTRMKYKEPYMYEQHIDISANGNSYADYRGLFYCPACYEQIEFDGRCPEEAIYKMIQLTNYLDIFEMVEEGKMVKLRDVLELMDDFLQITITVSGQDVCCFPMFALEFFKESILDRQVYRIENNRVYLEDGVKKK